MTGEAIESIFLDGYDWPVPPVVSTSVSKSLARDLQLSDWRADVGISALLGLATRSCRSSDAAARSVLVGQFGMPQDRARAAVGMGRYLVTDNPVNNHPLGYLAAVKLSEPRARRLLELYGDRTNDDGMSAGKINYTRVRAARTGQDVRRLAQAAASSQDAPTMAVTAALLASSRLTNESGTTELLHDALTQSVAHNAKATALERRRDRVLAGAYALSALAVEGLDVGDLAWSDATPSRRFDAAPWLLPLLDVEDSTPLRQLLDRAAHLGLGFVSVGTSPFQVEGDVGETAEQELLDAMLHRVSHLAAAGQLTKVPNTPLWFDGGSDGQVLLVVADDDAYAWVGRAGKGVLVGFDLTDFVGRCLDEPGIRTALAMAVAWYVDGAISLKKQSTAAASFTRRSAGTPSIYRYTPTSSFTQHVTDVAHGRSIPPRPHAVTAHIRHLGPEREPSEDAVDRAPRHLRRYMGPHDTYVRGYQTGGATGADELITRLSKHSMLADVLGEMSDQQSS
ncbi:hypothetical protein D1O33_24585 (plasmid) [Rhodococcus rhodochrous]|uniref:hypothetical protein n=1 Tax=Rhodococcus rhodochrous TaxID=1829 RepID=UPI00132F2D18|nr:hypothetical protein [Rhodococcus rhodochrous]QHG85251.1 hypothetical protein D1O33_24585 [Rhodococcus rhodochrous]